MTFANTLLLQLNNRMRGAQAGGLWTMQTGRCPTTTPAAQEAGAPQSIAPQPTPQPPLHPQIPHRRTSHHQQPHSTQWSHFNSHDTKWKVFGVVHVTTATLVIAYLTMLFSCLTIGLQIAILCSDNEGTWGFSRYSFNGFHTRQQTDQRSLMISANQLQQSGSSGNPTSFDDHFLLQNHPMPSNSELRSNLLAALQSTTITPLALASNIETVGDIDTPNVHHGAIRTRQTQDTIRRLGTEQTINMCVLTMLIYGVKTQRRWFLLPHLINAAIVMMTKFMVTFGGVFTSGGAGSASSPSSDGDYYAPVQYHAMSTGMIMLFINLFAFLIPFRCFVYFTERDRASTIAGPFANYDAYLRTRTGSDDSLLASAAAAGRVPNDHRHSNARVHRRSSTSALDASSTTGISSPPPYPHYAVPPVYAQGPPAYDTVVKAVKPTDTNTATMLVRPISDETGDAATSSNELVDETTTMMPDSDHPTAATRSRSQINVNQHQLEVLRKQSV